MLLMDKEKFLILLKNSNLNNTSFRDTLMMYLSENIFKQNINNLGVILAISDKREVDNLLKSRILLELNFLSVGNNVNHLRSEEKHFFLGKVGRT